MDSVKVEVSSRIFVEEDRPPEEIIVAADGWVDVVGDEWNVRYVTDEENVSLYSYADYLILTRRGVVGYQQTFQPGTTSTGSIQLDGGSLEMEIETKDYRREHSESEGKIHWSYEMNLAGQHAGRYELEVKWSRVDEHKKP